MTEITRYHVRYITRDGSANYGKIYKAEQDLAEIVADAMSCLRSGMDNFRWEKTKRIEVEAVYESGNTGIVRRVSVPQQ